jgi:hypothetical protein
MLDDFTERWLILEQEADRNEWCSSYCEHLVCHEAGGSNPGQDWPSGSPTEREICILFLPERHGTMRLPDAYTNRFGLRWNVWCHYGRDITMAECPQRWRSYARLSDEDKARLSREYGQPPLPFSRSMQQPWSECFLQIKEKVKQYDRLSSNPSKTFSECLDLFRRAWDLAKGTQSTQVRLDQARAALPVVVAARYLLDFLPAHAGADPQTQKITPAQALSICEESGMLAMAQRKENFSISVREAYRHFLFMVQALDSLEQSSDQRSITRITSLRWALHDLIIAAEIESNTISKMLMQHP